ncbi:DUF6414 family protein [Clostridium sp. DL1XJH146]
MSVNPIIVPLYLNKNMINNLFTIAIREFSQTQSLNTRKQVIMKADTPLGNVIPNKCLQGNFSFQYLDECSKQDTEKRVSIIIETLLSLNQIMSENKILNKIESGEQILEIKENDFVEVLCDIAHNPQIEQIKNIVKFMQFDLTFKRDVENYNSNTIESKKEILKMLKESIYEYENSKCLKYITSNLFETNFRGIIPIFKGFMEDSIDYLDDSRVTILGKVIRVTNNAESQKINLLSGTCFDYFNEQYFKNFMSTYFSSMYDNFLFYDANKETKCPLIEIIPIAIYV